MTGSASCERPPLARCQEFVDQAISSIGMEMRAQILTSRDSRSRQLRDQLETKNVPGGFRKWQLPVYLSEPSYLFITVAEPGARSTEHSHDDGDGIRFIISGSINYADQELTARDWMFIRQG
jgi:redox-sensitive bicupin YhaK (pirin superfamily)